jgi:hypothetical protein
MTTLTHHATGSSHPSAARRPTDMTAQILTMTRELHAEGAPAPVRRLVA